MSRSGSALAVAGFAIILSACTSGGPRSPEPVKIAFLENLDAEGSAVRVAPAFQGARLAIIQAILAGQLPTDVELVGKDLTDDPETAAGVVKEIVHDPAFVGAIAAPYLDERPATGAALDRAGVFTMSLSTLGPELASEGWAAWARAVANLREQGDLLAVTMRSLLANRADVCVAGDGTVESDGLIGRVVEGLNGSVVLRTSMVSPVDDPASLVSAVRKSGCGLLFWGGSSADAAVIRLGLDDAGLGGVRLVGGDWMKAPDYLFTAAAGGDGTIVACSCVDLNTSTGLNAQRFIQNFQAQYGSAPGTYAAEAWDVGRMFLQAISSGAASRAAVASWFESRASFAGLANTYVFRGDGELAKSSSVVRLYRDLGGRWLPMQRRQ